MKLVIQRNINIYVLYYSYVRGVMSFLHRSAIAPSDTLVLRKKIQYNIPSNSPTLYSEQRLDEDTTKEEAP